MLSRLHPDYEPVAVRTLNWYRRERIRLEMMRPLEEYQRRLRDEHVLMDPIRERAALILLQEARVQKAINLEQQLEGVVLPAVGQEIERPQDWSRVVLEGNLLGALKRAEVFAESYERIRPPKGAWRGGAPHYRYGSGDR
jgi:hypothetical protein